MRNKNGLAVLVKPKNHLQQCSADLFWNFVAGVFLFTASEFTWILKS